MKIAILTTDTDHHRYFINRLHKHFNDVYIVFEKRKIKKDYKLGPFFAEEQKSFNKRFFKNIPSSLDASILKNTISCLSVNGPKPIQFLEKIKPDVCVSFGTGILREKILNIPSMGTINIHRGIIEKYRGLDSDLWAILNEDFESIGTTVHIVDSMLDTGPVISQKRYNLKKDDKIFHIQYYTTVISTDLLINALHILKEKGAIPAKGQDKLGKYYTSMSLKDKMIALSKFKKHVRSL